jgi:hypothetical protein
MPELYSRLPLAETLYHYAAYGISIRTDAPMNPHTQKLIIPLGESLINSEAQPVSATYAVAPPSELTTKEVRITPISEKEAFITFLASTSNSAILDSCRLRRQFEATRTLANSLPVKKLSYPRSLQYLPLVLQAVLCDLCAEGSEVVACGA